MDGNLYLKEGGRDMVKDTTFNNPFEDINANVMDPKKILDFWCDPFASGFLTETNKIDFYTTKIPIILEGSRGSGKTTILKYFSFDVQFELSKKRKDYSYTRQVKSDGGIGIYFRCDESFIRTFQIVFSDKESKIVVFEHYLELFIIKNLFEIISKMDKHEEAKKIILEEIASKTVLEFSSFNDFENYISSAIAYIDAYKNNSVFTNDKFSPDNIFSMYQISAVMIEGLKRSEPLWKNINFIILIDEFENLDFELQKMFNSLLKFSKNEISFRVGRRSEGLITTETINETEYLRKNHDYTIISLVKDAGHKETKTYFEEIALKRFKSVTEFESLDINHIFGASEDLNMEAKKIAKNRKAHMYQILKTQNRISADKKLLEAIVDIISYPENPIAEMLNALWVIRSKNENKLEVARDVKKTMLSAITNNGSDTSSVDTKKYSDDYRNKYRYSLVVLLNSIYRKQKLYYSFNTICYLSNSNARMFINFCRAIINDALFYERKNFLKTRKISEETQSRAIREVSQGEFNNVSAIIKHGQKIGNLIQNIGNVFSDFHKDKKVRYPETNQFRFDINQLRNDYREVINVALSWSVIIARPRKQRASAGVNKKVSIYHLNRSYAPLFDISYRTRGGFNPEFTAQEIQDMCEAQITIYKIDKERNKESDRTGNEFEQLDLFEMENQDE